jgi:hypothetical protein
LLDVTLPACMLHLHCCVAATTVLHRALVFTTTHMYHTLLTVLLTPGVVPDAVHVVHQQNCTICDSCLCPAGMPLRAGYGINHTLVNPLFRITSDPTQIVQIDFRLHSDCLEHLKCRLWI